ELLVDTVLDTVASKAADVSDMDVMIYYYLHKDKFSKPETREAYHILITINDDFDENKRDAAYSRLADIRKRVIKKPERFGEQALKHSECPTAMREGFLGNIPKGELYPELDKALFSMKQGEISEIIESPVGFHILFCKSIDEAGPVSIDQAEPKIREHLQQKRRRMCQKNWLSDLANNTTGKQ
ncbi:MAG: nitrogen fixation protein NifM, partial [Gammaproteobacteria bacterium]